MSRLLTWNLQGRVTRLEEQAMRIDAFGAPALLCLQELTPTTAPRWLEVCAAMGMHALVSDYVVEPRGSRRLAVLIAARAPLERVEVPGLPWPERHLAVRTALDGAPVEVHCLHAPLSGKEGRAKVLTLEALFEALAGGTGPRVLAGDINTPQYESREGQIQTFARTRKGEIRAGFDERHDRAELLLIDELVSGHGWRDAFRAVNGYEARDRSWMYPNGKFGYRLDHIVVSPEVAVADCRYIHEWREQKLSDHSAMWADISVGG